jgi:hypothetical protein
MSHNQLVEAEAEWIFLAHTFMTTHCLGWVHALQKHGPG